MAVIKWGREGNRFSNTARMQREMGRLFNEFETWFGSSGKEGYQTTVFPPLNIYNDGECFIVRAELPGIDSKSLDLEVTGDTLTLKGKRTLPELENGQSYHRRERDFGEFRRSFSLPDRVNSSKVMAEYLNGILEIRLPHAEEAKARKISVKAS